MTAARDAVPSPTARLRFRTWRAGDLELARALFGDLRVTSLVGGPFTDDQVRARLETEIATQREHGYQYWPMFVGARDDFVGCCGLKPRDPARAIHELGFYVRASQWGHGFAVEAGQAVISHAFDVLGAAALFAGHHPDNAGSRRTLEKLGFRYVYDELYPPTGLMHPGYELRR